MKKLLYLLSVMFFLAIFFALFPSCNTEVHKEESNLSIQTEKELAKSYEIVDFKTFCNVKRGMTYAMVIETLNNPGEPSCGIADNICVYRLSNNCVGILQFTRSLASSSKLQDIRVEELVNPELVDYILGEVEKKGSVFIPTDYFGSSGVRISSGEAHYEYYLTDGRIVTVTYCGSKDGMYEINSISTSRVWFDP